MSFPDYTSLVQYANILHLWKLDEESGTRVDFIGDCDLADNNTVLYGSGKIGNGADFELGNVEYLDASAVDSADMNFTSGNFSFGFWIKPESLATYLNFICRGAWQANGYYIYFNNTTQKIICRVCQTDALQEVISNADLLSNGTLAHITIVRDGTTGYIYVNGSDETLSSDTLTDPATSARKLLIGIYDTETDNPLDGIMDELIVWNVALSSAEVSTLYSWYSKVGLSGAISFSGNLDRKPKKLLTGTISFIGTLQKLPKKLLTGAVSFAGVLSKLPKKTLTGAITFTGTLITKVKKTLTGSISFIGSFTHPYLDGIWNLLTKRDTTWTEKDKETTAWTRKRTDIYFFDFAYDDGNWYFSNASITGGVLDITVGDGYGQRSPDANWYSDSTDDFVLEVDFKMDNTAPTYYMTIDIHLLGDGKPICFDTYSPTMNIYYHPLDRESQTYTNDSNWHTLKIRRVGTVYYFSIDSGDEISWDYGTERALEYIQLIMMNCTGDFDNFKYYGLETTTWTEV